jgi:hypothetical protein
VYSDAGATAHGPCTYTVSPQGFFDIVEGIFAKQMCQKPSKTFRDIDWSKQIDKLHDIYHNTDKHLIFGSHHIEQIDYLKKQFGKDCVTVALNYTVDDYKFLLNNLAENHVRLITCGKLQPTAHDSMLVQTLTNSELVQYYQQEFDQMELIPRSVSDSLDYTINIMDFFNKQQVLQHITELGFDASDTVQQYYDYWFRHQTAWIQSS